MAFVLPKNPNFSNRAEKKFYVYSKNNLPNNYIVYFNYEVNYREFDFAIFIPERGIAMVEVKGWKAKNIVKVNDNNSMIYSTNNNKTIIETSPFKQAREYMFNLKNLINNTLNKNFKMLPFVCYPQILKDEYLKNNLDLFSRDTLTIFKEDLEKDNVKNKLLSAFDQINLPSVHDFDYDSVYSVRNMFENEVIEVENEINSDNENKQNNKKNNIDSETKKAYSKLFIIPDKDSNAKEYYDKIINDWVNGIKIYVCTNSFAVMNELKSLLVSKIEEMNLDQFLNKNISNKNMFMVFNFIIYKFTTEIKNPETITILNGKDIDSNRYKILLEKIDNTSSFNLQQYKLEHAEPHKNIYVKAGAGTGKTFSMTTRISYLIYIHDYSPEEIVNKIILITFTNKAADNMKEKIKEYLQDMFLLTKNYRYLDLVKSLSNMHITTIHSLAKRIIESFSSKLGLGTDFKMISGSYERENEIKKALNNYLQKNNLDLDSEINMYHFVKRIESLISKLENKNIDVLNDNIEFGFNDKNTQLHNLLKKVIIDSEKSFRDNIYNSNTIHLSNIIILVKQILKDNKDELRQLKYDYVFIDEFQDTDDNQIDLIKEFHQIINFNLFIVGDVKQCIYRFRGAELEAFDRLGIKDGQWLSYNLNENYRTDSKLLKCIENSFVRWNFNNKFMFNYGENQKLSSHKNINNDNDNFFNKVNVNKSKNEKGFSDKLKEIIDFYYDRLNKGESIAILTRTNYEVKEIKSYESKLEKFIETDIGASLYREKPALDLLKLIMALKNPESPEHLYGLFDTNYIKGSLPINWIIHNKLKGNDLVGLFYDFPPIKGWTKSINHLKDYPVLKVLRELVSKNKPYNNTPDFDEEKYRGYYKKNLDSLFEELVNDKNIEYLTLNNIEKSLKLKIYSDFDKEKRETLDLDNSQKNNIYCMTVHKAKGLEFNTVILPYTKQSVYKYSQGKNISIITENSDGKYHLGYKLNLTGKNSDNKHIYNDLYKKMKQKDEYYNISEEVRILYVAMTRAIKNLVYFSYADNNRKNLSWQSLIEGGS